MFKVCALSVLVLTISLGTLTGMAYSLGRFSADLERSMRPVARAGNVYPFPNKRSKPHRVMIAKK